MGSFWAQEIGCFVGSALEVKVSLGIGCRVTLDAVFAGEGFDRVEPLLNRGFGQQIFVVLGLVGLPECGQRGELANSSHDHDRVEPNTNLWPDH